MLWLPLQWLVSRKQLSISTPSSLQESQGRPWGLGNRLRRVSVPVGVLLAMLTQPALKSRTHEEATPISKDFFVATRN